jgi:hypothetical protein
MMTADVDWPWAMHVGFGCGVLVSPTAVLTVAHLVKDQNEKRVVVRSPSRQLDLAGTVELAADGSDLALIRLSKPTALTPAPIRPSLLITDHKVRIPGNLTANDEMSRIAQARVTGPDSQGGYSVVVDTTGGFPISPGHSGGAVIDDKLGAVVAICRSREKNDEVKVGRIIPIERAAVCWPELSPWLRWRLEEQRVVTDNVAWRELDARRSSALVTHWFPRSNGLQGGVGEGSESLNLFHGRFTARTEVAAWLNDATPGVLVVTGDPGSGKSALVARTVVDYPFNYAFFAKDRVAPDFLRGLCDALGEQPSDSIDVAAAAVRQHRPVVAIDGLDEAARGEDRSILEHANQLAQAGAKVLVGSRREVAKRLQAAKELDLDCDRYFDRSDLVAYCCDVLTRRDKPGDANAWRAAPGLNGEAAAIAAAAGTNFLVGGLVALARSIDDPGSSAGQRASNLDSAFDGLLASIDKRLGWEPE